MKMFSVPAPRWAWSISLLGLTVLLGGCTQLGPKLVQPGRNDYNQVLARSDQEEQLMNLVRMRYADNPLMLDVSSVSTSFEWSQNLSAIGAAFDSAESDSGLGVSGNIAYSSAVWPPKVSQSEVARKSPSFDLSLASGKRRTPRSWRA